MNSETFSRVGKCQGGWTSTCHLKVTLLTPLLRRLLALCPPQGTQVVCVSSATGLLGDHASHMLTAKFPDQACGPSPIPPFLIYHLPEERGTTHLCFSCPPTPLLSSYVLAQIRPGSSVGVERNKRRQQTHFSGSACPPPGCDPFPVFSPSPLQNLWSVCLELCSSSPKTRFSVSTFLLPTSETIPSCLKEQTCYWTEPG